MVPKNDKLKDGPIVPELSEKTSSMVVESLAALVALMLVMRGEEKLNCDGVRPVVEAIEMTMLPEIGATPELDLQVVLLSETHNEL